jgi:hypothetical protein
MPAVARGTRGEFGKVAVPTGEKQPACIPGSVSLEEQRARYPSLYLLDPAT